MPDDLFSSVAEERLKARAPLAERMRPTTLDEVVGQEHLLGPKGPLRVDRKRPAWLDYPVGPAGHGQDNAGSFGGQRDQRAFTPLSAVTAGVKDVRQVTEEARRRLGEQSRGTILFLDEVHRFNKSQQDALLPSVEDGTISLIGATTENPFFEVNAPLLSRSTLFRLEALTDDDLRKVAERALEREKTTAEKDALEHLVDLAGGDARSLLTSLDVAIALAGDKAIDLAAAEQAVQHRVLSYGEDDHYDVISAFIKSIRGSDPDAALYWLARMLEAGEDTRFIARRLVISASEDIGEADPQSLVVATAAAQALQFVGLPEASLNLAQAVVHLATAPKSNRSALGLWSAQADVKDRPQFGVPAHLRDSHYQGASRIGHGKGYQYPHDDSRGWLDQQYLPDELTGKIYYEPSDHGFEQRIDERMKSVKRQSGE